MVSEPVVANHKSALKRHRQSERRRVRNHAIKTRVRHLVREVRAAVQAKDVPAATATLGAASKALAKAASKGVLHRNNASRRIARLAHAVEQLTGTAS